MSAKFIDTNVALYSMSEDQAKRRQALSILTCHPTLSLQVLNEAANVMRRKLGFDVRVISDVLKRWLHESQLHPLSPSTLLSALEIGDRYGFSHYDSLIIAAALESRCTTLYSEDLQDGQVINNRLTVVNPFK
ncbi:PIN domain-containing protein [Thiorhodovibrio frisius]|uniref:Putative nucleic-acid-binding protein n=1 Tax=Thiorhodovibrio frisius TaxID=631362 RepID=H8Z2D3_9GAMM|nr:PIN domain-containing protein [Thiorhodovibrio frisius]EIC21588.1 putative nucleic-acid-binding protein [Thiorhodovibrio frisius]WPL21555.1 putative nucleic-acid-binding protein, contains PIN domain [Thiorhodovibrio frisius]